MDILQYTKEQNKFRERLRKFLAKEVTPYADDWEARGIVPKEVWKKMGQNGFLCMGVPPKYGGLGGDFRYSVIVADEMARTNQEGLAAMLHTDVVVPYIETFGSGEIKAKYLPGCVSGDVITAIAMTEPDAGSDLASMCTSAVEDGDDVLISGSKIFISNGINSDLVVVAARDPKIDNAHRAISLYLIEDQTPGFSRGRRLAKMGFHSQDTAELFFSNCRIPKANRLGKKGMGFSMLMEKLQQERLSVTIAAVPIAEFLLEQTIHHCRTNVISGKPMINHQAVQFALVEMSTEVKLGRTFTDKLVMDHIEGKEITVETSMAKYWTTEMAKRIADRCMDLFGEDANYEKCPIVRGWRDVRLLSIFAGTNEIMKTVAAKFMGL
ncbi:MAG: acyl-CoA dehydrogenase [Desulfobacterales bacterium]|nr:acyl-CoA dehydrogenase family protein [Deltaproteobacteria bacterium]NNL42911.1 acyl-CoA dehydrogenase [Desulfobacterales bacterium]